ncbi:DUF2157 domain-containing protein [Aliidiomarina taiwanensis]|uniref:DUF2157 domain-containing protein n=1 Tax=Aliidiomarina taiwanensis TaxID=946228 RepID=A0A432WYT8_9GAMM|nr:DUF2157 domain-containing protein [Aliidiomarina taiwanensis]RUO38935.1 DUF2157 domain-containing protein [Aliidiomarina taiwanensis]
MSISKQQLREAVLANIITEEQAQQLEGLSAGQSLDIPQFTLTHVLYYFGGCLAVAAMSLLMSLSWETFGGGAIFLLAILYAAIGLIAVQVLGAKQLNVPKIICAVFVVSLTPIAVYGLLQWLQVWPEEINNYSFSVHRLALELSTLVVGIRMFRSIPASLITLPIIVSLLSLAWNIVVFALGQDIARQGEEWIIICFGLLLIMAATAVDVRTKKVANVAFWAHILGAVMLWQGLTEQSMSNELPKLAYFILNLLIIGVGAFLGRRVYGVFGVLGSIGYLGYLAFDVFRESWAFPVILTAIGLGVVFLGVWWQKNSQAITARLQRKAQR